MRITIGGCRTYKDFATLKSTLDIIISKITNNEDITVLSGHRTDVDILAERYAAEKGYAIEIHSAQWNKFGRAAGPIRNEAMVKNCDYIIAFWDGSSKGTKNLISLALKYNKPYTIKYIKPPS